MPTPVSVTVNAMYNFDCLDTARVIFPFYVNLKALLRRFMSTCLSRSWSELIMRDLSREDRS